MCSRILAAILAVCFLLSVSACAADDLISAAPAGEPAADQTSLAGQTALPQTQRYEDVFVDIRANGDGHYSLVGTAEVQLGERGVERLTLEEPALLAFSVSSAYAGGVWVMDLKQGETVLSSLREVQTSLSRSGNTALAQEIGSVIAQLETAGPYTQAST